MTDFLRRAYHIYFFEPYDELARISQIIATLLAAYWAMEYYLAFTSQDKMYLMFVFTVALITMLVLVTFL